MVRIGFIGAGNIGRALMQGILDVGVTDSQGIIASGRDKDKLAELHKLFEIETTTDNNNVVKNSDVIFIAVKPQDINPILDEIKASITPNKIIVSVAAGITLAHLESKLGQCKLVRVMPNTPCLVGEMAAGYAMNKKVTNQEISTIEVILKTGGKAYPIKEELLDAVTGLSGSGPAFVAYLIEAFKDAGIKNGLDEKTAYALTLQTFIGTAKLLFEKNMQPQELISHVSSPNGTTVAGREILEKSDVQEIVQTTISRAVQRSKELGKKETR